MAPHCDIHFDSNHQGVYHGGETLTGSVELRLDKPKLVNEFRLVISGCAEVKWSERKSKDRKVTYTGKEELLRAETYLIHQQDDKTEIPAGTHIYNFSSPIPREVPTSFEGEYGKIRYTVRAILDRPWKFDQTSTAAFTVIKPLDLNERVLDLKEPSTESISEIFCSWSCTSNPLNVNVELPVSGYVPGQNIPITVTINNTSTVVVGSIKSKLERKESYISKYPHKKTRTVTKSLASVWTNVDCEEQDQYIQQLEIPSVPPTGKCSVLGIEYFVKVKILVAGCHVSPRMKIPITIGTVPFALPLAPPIDPNAIGWSDAFSLPTAPDSPGMDDIPPPSYEEAMNGMRVNVNDDEPNAIGFQSFVPRYPVYKCNDTARQN